MTTLRRATPAAVMAVALLASTAFGQAGWTGNVAVNPGFEEDFVNAHAEGHVLSNPLTLVLPRKRNCTIADLVSAGLDTIALRAPSHPVARALLDAAMLPIAAPSANRSGRISPTTAEHVEAELVAENYFGVSGPAGMPMEAADKLHAALNQIIADPAIVKRFEELGITPMKMSGADFAAFVGKQVADWAPAIKAADVKN